VPALGDHKGRPYGAVGVDFLVSEEGITRRGRIHQKPMYKSPETLVPYGFFLSPNISLKDSSVNNSLSKGRTRAVVPYLSKRRSRMSSDPDDRLSQPDDQIRRAYDDAHDHGARHFKLLVRRQKRAAFAGRPVAVACAWQPRRKYNLFRFRS